MLLLKLVWVVIIAFGIALALDHSSGGDPRNQQGPYVDQ
jgi:hypothetical protein